MKIALIEPNAACAAELGQLLSDTLHGFPVELSDSGTADLVLLDQNAGEIPDLKAPAIVFARSEGGRYRASAIRAGGASSLYSVPLMMPLTESVLCALLLRGGTPNRFAEDSAATSATTLRRNGTREEVRPEHQEKLQSRLLHSQKMEAVAELAGGIAHDFNNLLLVIRSYAEMLQEETPLSPMSLHYVKEIVAASLRASTLTGELLSLGRREPPSMLPSDLNALIQDAVPMLSRLVGKNIAVWAKLPEDLWEIRCNRDQLEQVLVNLAANARDAMPHGGKLLLETTNAVIEDKSAAMPPGSYVMLAVSDTGVGIPKHLLSRIFEPFYTTKERGKGTGLGLASVHGAVKQSGGYIWAYSETGYGTTFKIYLPRTAGAHPGKHASPQKLSFGAAAGA